MAPGRYVQRPRKACQFNSEKANLRPGPLRLGAFARGVLSQRRTTDCRQWTDGLLLPPKCSVGWAGCKPLCKRLCELALDRHVIAVLDHCRDRSAGVLESTKY